jgi:protein involved in polysaccharide export with SLBB domain
MLASLLMFAGCASDPQMSAYDLQNNAQSGIYDVSGAVIHPGEFHLPPGEYLTLGQAIRRSGGFKPGNSWDDGGDSDAVRVQRVVHGSVVEYTLLASPGGRDEAFIVRPGDHIFVPKRTFSTPISNPLPFAT